jgi:hypothetical protein
MTVNYQKSSDTALAEMIAARFPGVAEQTWDAKAH